MTILSSCSKPAMWVLVRKHLFVIGKLWPSIFECFRNTRSEGFQLLKAQLLSGSSFLGIWLSAKHRRYNPKIQRSCPVGLSAH